MPRTRTSDVQDRLRSQTTLAAHLLTFLAVFAVAPAQADEPAKPPAVPRRSQSSLMRARS